MIQQKLIFFSWYYLQVVLKGDPKKLSLHGVRINIWTESCVQPMPQRSEGTGLMRDHVIDVGTCLSLFCPSHSRRAPCVWRTSKWKTSWECCHANMLSTGSEYKRVYLSFSFCVFFSSCSSWPSALMNGEYEWLRRATVGALAPHHRQSFTLASLQRQGPAQ